MTDIPCCSACGEPGRVFLVIAGEEKSPLLCGVCWEKLVAEGLEIDRKGSGS